jgi:hypothetical protein
MVFLTKINFVLSFDENNRITGFIVYPVKLEWDEDNREQSPVKCEEAEAEAWALSALLHDTGTEWIADFDSKEAADNFATLLQSIYRAGVRSHEKDPDAISIVWGYEDVIGQARTHDIIVTPDEARGILQDMKDGHDCNNGITWETINAHVWQLKRVWIDRDILTNAGGAQVGTFTCSYPGGMPYLKLGAALTVWYQNEWREVNPLEWTFDDPIPNTGLLFVHSEFDSDLSGEEDATLQYRIERPRPDCCELSLYKDGEEYLNSYLYDSAEEARADIRLAAARYNITFTDIGTEE